MMNVYWSVVKDEDPYEIEQQMIEYFSHGVSDKSRAALFDQNMAIPFANLELRNLRKIHGFKNQTI